MTKIILIGSFCLYLLIYHPGWVLLAGLVAVGFYIFRGYELKQREERDKEPEVDFAPGLTREAKAEQEVEKRMKPGYRQNPEWQALSKKVKDHIEKARAHEEAERKKKGQNIKNWA